MYSKYQIMSKTILTINSQDEEDAYRINNYHRHYLAGETFLVHTQWESQTK